MTDQTLPPAELPAVETPEIPAEVQSAMAEEGHRLRAVTHSYLQSRVVELATENVRLRGELVEAHDAYEQLSRLITNDTPAGDSPEGETNGEGES